MNRLILLAMAGTVACAPAAESADSTDSALPAIDTMKASPETAVRSGSTTSATSQPNTMTPTKATPTKTPATKTPAGAPPDTTNIGRDRAIQIDTKDPKVRLPTVDTTKRPPK